MKSLLACRVRHLLTAAFTLASLFSAVAWFSFVGPAWATPPCPASANFGCPTSVQNCYPFGPQVDIICCTTGQGRCCHFGAGTGQKCYYDAFNGRQPCPGCLQPASGDCNSAQKADAYVCDSSGCTADCVAPPP
jgi:hypothetical protein